MQGHGRMKWKGQNTVREAWKWKAFKGDKKKQNTLKTCAR